ncbi:hydrogenase formation protein HypD [Desulfosediminicola ganghwensis]|uniref:hydrogenase formation protein HypD n=1 Tax=Desulfosediminicola ganghwensis TaxID=2569540 RepID=UPI0010ABF772|nr:hydrogenase formation protein HypD [Desulfosediminicola ganghwensis]
MKHYDEYRDAELIKPLVEELHRSVTKPLRVMEVCGSHTMAIFRNGLRSILPDGLELVSGPGCPVCVTSAPHMDAFIAMADRPGVRVAIFGDLFRVPGSNGSLANASSRGARVDIVYSPMDALEIAKNNPDELVVFLGVGFETTTPTIAATIMAAKVQNVQNFNVFSTQKTMPVPLNALLGDPELKIDGLLCPGHVSSIIGAKAYQPLAEKFGLACVVAGFETADLVKSLSMLARQVATGDIKVENVYSRVVNWEGNPRAQKMVYEIFEPCDTDWRGLGVIPGSGLKIRDQYQEFDAQVRLEIELPEVEEAKGCMCGQILKGINTPQDCPLYAKRCTPANPIGPCMVSSEGTCAAYFKYGQD